MPAAAPARAEAAPARAPRRAPSRRRPQPRRPARRRPARRSAPRPNRALVSRPRRAAPARAPKRRRARASAAAVPIAVGRTAGAVRDLSESSLVHRLTRGRLWIGLLGGLLAGIVALNVISLGLNASSGRVAQQVEELERANSALRAQLAEQLSAGRVQSSAAAMGLVVPDPSTITYLTSGDRDAERAAKLLAGEPVEGGPAPAAPDPAPPAPTATSAPQPAPYSPAPVEQPAPAPAAEAPAAPPPASGEAGSAGGVGAGL